MRRLRLPLVLLIAGVLAICAATPALARDDDVRVRGSCGGGASAELRLTARDGEIRVEFKVDTRRAGRRWRVVLIHERRVVWRGRARTRSSSGAFRIRRSIPNFRGADEVAVRASGPGGNACEAKAVLTAS